MTVQEWTKVTRKGSSGGASRGYTGPTTRDNLAVTTAKGTSKSAPSRRCTLLQARNVQAQDFSPIVIRNLINNAFKAKGIVDPVVSTASLSPKGNIVVYTTPEFTADFLIEKQAIIKGVLPLLNSLQKAEPWHKVIIHGIPIREFNAEDGMELIAAEIKTFNKGFTPIGRPYWATPRDKRDSGQLKGSVIVAFPTESQAKKAIKNRLYIAGISTKVAKFLPTDSTAQCSNCGGFGHLDRYCKRPTKCLLCGSSHKTSNHKCTVCNKTGEVCPHLTPSCCNCNSTTHSANSKLCEVYIALKSKSTITPIIIDE